MVASPSGLVQERAAVVQAIHSWNEMHAEEMNMVVLPKKWETDVTPAFGREPQVIINQSIVDPCDLLIAFFGETLGTKTERAASGTVEEIMRVHEAGKPVLLYFGERVAQAGLLDPAQLTALQDFRKFCRERSLYGAFTDADDLARKVERHLLQVMRKLRFPDDQPEVRPSTNYTLTDDVLTLRTQLTYYDQFATEPDGETVILENPRILLANVRFANMRDMIPVLEQVARSGDRLLLIASRIEGEALATLATNRARGTIHSCPVAFDTHDREALLAIKKFTGATIFGELGRYPESADIRDLGLVAKAVITQNSTRLWRAPTAP